MLLNCMAVANIVGGGQVRGHGREFEGDFGGENGLDTLVNIVVCSQYLGKYGGRDGQVSKCVEGGACIASVCSGTCAS